ncbi:uncharacterized protein LOC27208377 isoform X1 [Drosophila simulans]|uniref:Uncharacterized protein, isoform B n=1 Tax=Drosophila simulans TaxID=7240 RepID=A0A0J9R303_DROSI|nr:uncharacterized protein LOC27208377 isoform X1 [Drosophila simulans]KMY90443.1 uncharacterized protein Dsimw501_GD28530, isoform B [Drosophila simulans]
MKRLVPILVVEIIVLCRPLPTQQRQFPIVKNNGCAAIKNSVDPPIFDGNFWIITRWLKYQNTKPFECFREHYSPDMPLATRQSVFLETDNKNYAVHLTCLGADSSEESDEMANYLVQTYAIDRRPSVRIMKKILQTHKRHGLDMKFLKCCV